MRVDDEASLVEGASWLRPDVAVVDLGQAPKGCLDWLRAVRHVCPGPKAIVLGVHTSRSFASPL